MTEHDLHDPLRRLAEAAPAPAPGLAGDIVERGRTTRRRRLGAVAVAAAAAAAALAVVVPLLGSGSADRSAEPSVATDPTTPTEPAHAPGPSARMQVVAAAVRAHLNQNYPSYDDLWVRDSVCDRSETVGPGPVPCADLTEQEKTDLERLLQAYTIKWVGSVREIWSPTGQLNRPFVKISELEAVSTDGGSVFVYALRGGRDCAGVSYQVRLLPDGPPTVSPGDQFLIC